LKLKRTPADKWFSDCIRIAVNWTCERCNRPFGGRSQGLHCSHWIGRGISYATRFEPLNAFSHCYGCHQLLGADTQAFYEYAEKELGSAVLEDLAQQKNDTNLGKAFKKADKSGELAKFFKGQFEDMEQQRLAGNTSTLHVVAWEAA